MQTKTGGWGEGRGEEKIINGMSQATYRLPTGYLQATYRLPTGYLQATYGL